MDDKEECWQLPLTDALINGRKRGRGSQQQQCEARVDDRDLECCLGGEGLNRLSKVFKRLEAQGWPSNSLNIPICVARFSLSGILCGSE